MMSGKQVMIVDLYWYSPTDKTASISRDMSGMSSCRSSGQCLSVAFLMSSMWVFTTIAVPYVQPKQTAIKDTSPSSAAIVIIVYYNKNST